MVVTESANRRRKTCFVGASPFSTIPEVRESIKILKMFYMINKMFFRMEMLRLHRGRSLGERL